MKKKGEHIKYKRSDKKGELESNYFHLIFIKDENLKTISLIIEDNFVSIFLLEKLLILLIQFLPVILMACLY